MDKSLLLQHIVTELSHLQENAIAAAQEAHNTATHEENVAENKYDTLGLEAAYLAHGQSQRVAECTADLQAYRVLKLSFGTDAEPIKVSSLVTISDEEDSQLKLFLGPSAGGVKIAINGSEVVIVTPASPLGQALIGKSRDDEFEVKIGEHAKRYFVEEIE